MAKDYQTFNDEERTDNEPNKDSSDQSLLVDQLMEKAGYSYYQYKLIIMCNFLLFADGIHMNITNNLYIPIKNYYSLNDTTFSLISSVLFVGVGLGSLISGFVSNNTGRKTALIFANVFMFIFSLIMAFSNNYILFTVCRFFIGTLLGIVIPMLFGILTEYLPVKYRAFVLVCVWTGFSLGEIYTLFMMLIFTPNYELSGVPSVLVSCSIPFALIALCLFFWLDESPRMLILEKRETEGLKLLELMTNKELTNDEKDRIVGEIKGGINKELQVSLKYLFHHDFLKISVILIFIWAFNSYILYGGKFTLQQTLTRISSTKSINNKPKDVIIEQIIIQFITLPGNFISPIFSEIKCFGRIYSTALFYLLASIFQLLGCIFRNHFSILYGFSNLCSGSAFNISSAYTSEVYPTLIRDMALGFFYFCTRVAGFSSQFISVSLENVMFLLQYYTIIMVCLLGAIIVSLLPVETFGSPIDMPIMNDRIILEKPALEITKKGSI